MVADPTYNASICSKKIEVCSRVIGYAFATAILVGWITDQLSIVECRDRVSYWHRVCCWRDNVKLEDKIAYDLQF